MEANRPLEISSITAQVQGNQIILKFGQDDYILRSADPNVNIDMHQLLPLFQKCIQDGSFQENIAMSSLCGVNLDAEKIDLYQKQGIATKHLEAYIKGVAQNAHKAAMRRPPFHREALHSHYPIPSREMRREDPLARLQGLRVERELQSEPHERPASASGSKRHVRWADDDHLVEQREYDVDEQDEEEENVNLHQEDEPSPSRFSQFKAGLSAFSEKLSRRFAPRHVEEREDAPAILAHLKHIQSRSVKRRSLVESNLAKAARQQGATVELNRKDYQPKGVDEVKFLSKLQELDLNNPTHVDKLAGFYAKMCVINQEKNIEKLIDLYADEGFFMALERTIDHLNALANSTNSPEVAEKLKEISQTFHQVVQGRQVMGQLIVNDLAGNGTGEWTTKFIDLENPLQTSKNLTNVVKIFMKEMNRIEDNIPHDEKMAWASDELARVMSEWIREKVDHDQGVKTLERFLKVARLSASRGDYFTANCITRAIPSTDNLNTWGIGAEKWRYEITNAFNRINRAYDDLTQAKLLKKGIIHPGYFYSKEMSFKQKLSAKELGSPFRFIGLKDRLSKIELESNRLQKAEERSLESTLTSQDFTITNFKEVELLKKIRDLKDQGINSNLEIKAWRQFYAKCQVIQQAQQDEPSLLIHLFENKDFLDVLQFGVEKFKGYGGESSAISKMFQGILDKNRK